MDSKQLMDSFGGEEVKQASLTDTPICKLIAAENNFLHGVLTGHKTKTEKELDDKGNPKVTHIHTFTLIASNAEFIKKNKKKDYEPVKVVAGEPVTIYGTPAKLVKHLVNVAEGEEVFILYKGKKEEVEGKRKVNAHRFDVRKRKVAMTAVPD